MHERQGTWHWLCAVDYTDFCGSRFNRSLTAAREENFDGVYDIQTNTIQYSAVTQPSHARWEAIKDEDPVPATAYAANDLNYDEPKKELAKLSSVYSRNFRIHDLCLESAPESQFGHPGMDRNSTSLFNVSRAILDEMPPECLQSFEDARERELNWRSGWLTEKVDGQRTQFLPTTSWFS